MKAIVIVFMLFLAATPLNAQQVVASSGNTGSTVGYTVDWTLGEPVIETISGSTHILTQGMHQTKLLVTAISEMEFPGLEVRVYPNPTGRFLNIEIIQSGNEQFLYELTDITGRKSVLKQMHANTEGIAMGSYVSGFYFLTVTTETGNTWKLSKSKKIKP